MRYYVLPREGISDDLLAALSRGLGLSPQDADACRNHCARYGVTDLEAFAEELEEAQAALAAARALGATVMVDGQGRLCYDLPDAPDAGAGDEAPPWHDDAWLAGLFGACDESPSPRRFSPQAYERGPHHRM